RTEAVEELNLVHGVELDPRVRVLGDEELDVDLTIAVIRFGDEIGQTALFAVDPDRAVLRGGGLQLVHLVAVEFHLGSGNPRGVELLPDFRLHEVGPAVALGSRAGGVSPLSTARKTRERQERGK